MIFHTHRLISHIISFAMIGVILSLSIAYNLNSGFMLNREAFIYLDHYLEPRPIIEKIFDFRKNDVLPADYYRPRDLGNIFNYIDAEMVLLSLRFNIRGLLSITHYVSLIFFALIQMYFAGKFFGRYSYWPVFLSLLLFITSPGAFFTGNYIRTSKSVITVFLAIIFWLIAGIYRKQIRQSKTILILLFILSVSMALIDEVGIVFLLGFTAVAFFIYLADRSKDKFFLMLNFTLALVAAYFYRIFLGPFIIYRLFGIWPQVWDVKLFLIFNLKVITDGAVVFFRLIGSMFGNSSINISIIIFLTLSAVIFRLCIGKKDEPNKIKGHFWLAVYYLVGLYAVFAISLMVKAHAALLEPVNLLQYYPIPIHAFFALVVTVVACNAVAVYPKLRQVMVLLLASIAILNVLTLPYYEGVIAADKVQQYLGGSAIEVIDPALAVNDNVIYHIDPTAWNYNAVRTIRSRLKKDKLQ